MKRLFIALLLTLGTLASSAFAADQVATGVVVQANGSKTDFERALKLASNMHEVLAKAQFEVVVYGPAVQLLTDFGEEVPLIQKVQSEGIKIIACGRSLKTDNVHEEDLAPNVSVVPFGAVHIVNRQKQGWQYFRP